MPSLLDQNIENYITKKKGKFLLHFDIEDEKGNKLGKIKPALIEFNKWFLFDSNNLLVLTSKKKYNWGDQYYEIKNSSGILIGTVKGKGMVHFNDVVWMEDNNGKKVLRSDIPITELPYGIYDDKGDVVAEITNKKEFGFFSSHTPWSLKVLDLSCDRISLLGFFLSIYGEYVSTRSDGGGA